MASGTSAKNTGIDPSLDGFVRFVTRTLWVLGMFLFGLLMLVVGAFIQNPELAAIIGAFGLLMSIIAVAIYAVFAILRYLSV